MQGKEKRDGNRPLNVVLAGCGGISRAWVKPLAAAADVRFVGLMDINRAAAEKLAAEAGFKDAIVGTDLDEVLRAAKPDIVFDCSVPEAHVNVTLTALSHGCHVLGEKPLADTMENARKMVAAAGKAGRTYAVMQNRRYMANIRSLRRFIESGAIGRITTVYSDFFIGAHFGGFRDRMEHVLLLDMAIHTFDAARLITGEDPVSALCHEWNPPGSWYDHDASAVAVFQMTHGVVYGYRGSWCSEGRNTPWESSWRIIGDRGSVTWDGGTDFRAQMVTRREGFVSPLQDTEVPMLAADGGREGHAGCIDDFLDCIRTGRTPQTNCRDNIKSLAMVHGAIESAQRGQKVTIELKEVEA